MRYYTQVSSHLNVHSAIRSLQRSHVLQDIYVYILVRNLTTALNAMHALQDQQLLIST